MENIIAVVVTVAAIALLIKLLSTPIRWIWKICINTAAGCILLMLSNLLAELTGFWFYIDINFLHGCLVGFLGLPGYVLALLHQIFF